MILIPNAKEEPHMKKLLCLVLMLAGLTGMAHADGWVELRPRKGE